MLATNIIRNFQTRGFAVSLTDEGKVRVTPASQLTDDDRHLIKCYKPELLWRLRHPEGDPPATEYTVPVFIDGERVRIPMARLIAEGKEIVGDSKPKTKGMDLEAWAASVALGRYDHAHREWVESKERNSNERK